MHTQLLRRVKMSKELIKEFDEAMKEIPTNATWAEEDSNVWKGWTYSPEKKRYYFDDIGNESLAEFWSDPFLNQAYTNEENK
jgi:hypothetical protein